MKAHVRTRYQIKVFFFKKSRVTLMLYMQEKRNQMHNHRHFQSYNLTTLLEYKDWLRLNVQFNQDQTTLSCYSVQFYEHNRFTRQFIKYWKYAYEAYAGFANQLNQSNNDENNEWSSEFNITHQLQWILFLPKFKSNYLKEDVIKLDCKMMDLN